MRTSDSIKMRVRQENIEQPVETSKTGSWTLLTIVHFGLSRYGVSSQMEVYLKIFALENLILIELLCP